MDDYFNKYVYMAVVDLKYFSPDALSMIFPFSAIIAGKIVVRIINNLEI